MSRWPYSTVAQRLGIPCTVPSWTGTDYWCRCGCNEGDHVVMRPEGSDEWVGACEACPCEQFEPATDLTELPSEGVGATPPAPTLSLGRPVSPAARPGAPSSQQSAR